MQHISSHWNVQPANHWGPIHQGPNWTTDDKDVNDNQYKFVTNFDILFIPICEDHLLQMPSTLVVCPQAYFMNATGRRLHLSDSVDHTTCEATSDDSKKWEMVKIVPFGTF